MLAHTSLYCVEDVAISDNRLLLFLRDTHVRQPPGVLALTVLAARIR
jgi:hypothetical protein